MRLGSTIAVISLLLVGCGSESDGLKPVSIVEGPPPCIGCGIVIDETEPEIEITLPTATPKVVALPSQLMFYGSIDSAAVNDPRVVTITNDTTSTIQVLAAYIVDAHTFSTEGIDAHYFRLEEPSLEEPLMPGDTLDVIVSFVVSSEQRGAYLVIETSHPGHKSLAVSLSGKIFVGW